MRQLHRLLCERSYCAVLSLKASNLRGGSSYLGQVHSLRLRWAAAPVLGGPRRNPRQARLVLSLLPGDGDGASRTVHIFLPHPSSQTVRAVREAPAELALFCDESASALLVRFGNVIDWLGQVIQFNEVRQGRPCDTAGLFRAPDCFDIILVDATGGVVRAVRSIAVPDEFRARLSEAAEMASRSRSSRSARASAVTELHARFPTAELLVANASIRCHDPGASAGKPWRRY